MKNTPIADSKKHQTVAADSAEKKGSTVGIKLEPNSRATGDVKLEQSAADQKSKPREINGPKGLEPTRYGDWESKGRCHDF